VFYVYAIKSEIADWIYVGLTHNLDQRLAQHNQGYNKSTKPYRPFKLIYTEEHPDRISARKREKYLKSAAGKRFLRSR
jgi:putative endonuclease